jgi:hypothetical protein
VSRIEGISYMLDSRITRFRSDDNCESIVFQSVNVLMFVTYAKKVRSVGKIFFFQIFFYCADTKYIQIY